MNYHINRLAREKKWCAPCLQTHLKLRLRIGGQVMEGEQLVPGCEKVHSLPMITQACCGTSAVV